MNLHIAPDNTFVNKFYENLEELGLTGNNKIIIRSNESMLKAIKPDLPFAPLYSSRFSAFVGDTTQYEKVFIHYLTPLLYRWIATHKFQEVNWMVWGGDLYNLPSLDRVCYEKQTWHRYIEKDWSAQTMLYNTKIRITQNPFRRKAYAKIKNILTWMHEEYKFACNHLPVQADHKFFFYENQMPYEKLDAVVKPPKKSDRPSFLLGNSGSPANNHLDALQFLEDNCIQADLMLPVSYGDSRYISFLKRNVKFSYGKVEFIDRYMAFDAYLNFLASSDGLIMNTIRPQGYGNILMMMYMEKPVFFNSKNISLPDLDAAGIVWHPMESLKSYPNQRIDSDNKQGVSKVLSHEKLLRSYRKLF